MFVFDVFPQWYRCEWFSTGNEIIKAKSMESVTFIDSLAGVILFKTEIRWWLFVRHRCWTRCSAKINKLFIEFDECENYIYLPINLRESSINQFVFRSILCGAIKTQFSVWSWKRTAKVLEADNEFVLFCCLTAWTWSINKLNLFFVFLSSLELRTKM